MTIEFTPWPKIPRLFRDVVITEKIDGTNAAVVIEHTEDGRYDEYAFVPYKALPDGICVAAQSRTRLITPESDNFGFATWVWANAEALVETLGEGRHFGEWWGSGIQRGYGLTKGEKRFSLFNTPRYTKPEFDLTQVPGLGTVPVLYEGPFSTYEVEACVEDLRSHGSVAAPGFDNPEGVITFHVAAQTAFKTTLEKDESPKGIDA